MGSKISKNPQLIYLLLLLGASLILSSQMATAATAPSLSSAAPCNESDSTCQVEAQLSDEVKLPLDLELHRRVLAGSIGYQSVLSGDRPACNPNCGNPGTSYTANGCTYQNHCGQ